MGTVGGSPRGAGARRARPAARPAAGAQRAHDARPAAGAARARALRAVHGDVLLRGDHAARRLRAVAGAH